MSFSFNEVMAGGNINCICYDPVLNFIIYCYRNLVCFHNCETNAPFLSVEIGTVTCIYHCPNLQTLFLGTVEGEVMAFNWPNKPSNLVEGLKKVKLHAGRVVDMKVTSDLKELISVADDRSLSINSITYVKNLKRMQGAEMIEFMPNQLKLCYDFLSRKGICQYTHGK